MPTIASDNQRLATRWDGTVPTATFRGSLAPLVSHSSLRRFCFRVPPSDITKKLYLPFEPICQSDWPKKSKSVFHPKPACPRPAPASAPLRPIRRAGWACALKRQWDERERADQV